MPAAASLDDEDELLDEEAEDVEEDDEELEEDEDDDEEDNEDDVLLHLVAHNRAAAEAVEAELGVSRALVRSHHISTSACSLRSAK